MQKINILFLFLLFVVALVGIIHSGMSYAFPVGWQTYKNVQYHYAIAYPPGAYIQSEEWNPKNGQPVSKALNEVSSIAIVLPTISVPTDQGAPKPIMVQYSLSMKVGVKANPSQLTVEKWLQTQPKNRWLIGTEKISLHGLPAIKCKQSLAGVGCQTCVYVGWGAWIYQICYLDSVGVPEPIEKSLHQTFKQMLQSFELLPTQRTDAKLVQ